MKYREIKKLIEEKAPAAGYVLAYTRKCLLFKPYSDKGNVEGLFAEDADIVEIHLFNDEKEYRIVSSESRRYESGYVDHVADFESGGDSTYVQNIYLDLRKEDMADISADTIEVVNHIKYTDEGMAYIDDYRLSMK